MEKTGSNQALHEEILKGIERMDGEGGNLGELPRILKTILESVQAGKRQLSLRTLDGREVLPIVALEEFMDTVVKYPRLAQEFHLIYLSIFTQASLGSPLIGRDDLQGMAARKEEKMTDFLKGVDLEDQWSMLTDAERRVAYASLFDQLSGYMIDALQSRGFVEGFVEKYGFGKAATDVVES